MEFTERTLNKIMILKGGSPAMHMLGNIGRKDDDYIRVYAESEDEYIGVFEEGFGFIDVRFKKNDSKFIKVIYDSYEADGWVEVARINLSKNEWVQNNFSIKDVFEELK